MGQPMSVNDVASVEGRDEAGPKDRPHHTVNSRSCLQDPHQTVNSQRCLQKRPEQIEENRGKIIIQMTFDRATMKK